MSAAATPWKNRLYLGDNLEVLCDHLAGASMDLVYLDPPALSRDVPGLQPLGRTEYRSSSDQGRADSLSDVGEWGAPDERSATHSGNPWSQGWGPEAAGSFYDVVTFGPDAVAQLLQAFRALLGLGGRLAYLVLLAARLVEIHWVLKPTGSLYLHAEAEVADYQKLLLDALFGPENFRSQIVWGGDYTPSDEKNWAPAAQPILYYVKDGRQPFAWNPQVAPIEERGVEEGPLYREADGRSCRLEKLGSREPCPGHRFLWRGHRPPRNGWAYSREELDRLDGEGRIWHPHDPGKRPRLKRFLDERATGPLTDLWNDLRMGDGPHSQSQLHPRRELHGFPEDDGTEGFHPGRRPEALVERLIRASSNPGEVVLDPFCGSGTTLLLAEGLGRRWVGIDIAAAAISRTRKRLSDQFGAALHPFDCIHSVEASCEAAPEVETSDAVRPAGAPPG